ncbi:hypothetical protein T484DRAFT_1969746, partial [Baffinella frigidus]
MITTASLLTVATLVTRSPAFTGRILPLGARRFAAPRAGMCSIRAAADPAVLAALEKQGLAASEAWDTKATDFLDPETVAAAEKIFADRADLGFVKVGGYAAASRSRFVFTNPELLDSIDAAEHFVMLRATAIWGKDGNRFGKGGQLIPNLLAGIGVEFSTIGDVQYDEENSMAYIVCEPSVHKNIMRLLPKSLGRVTVEPAEAGFEPEDTSLVDLVVMKVDTRQAKKQY